MGGTDSEKGEKETTMSEDSPTLPLSLFLSFCVRAGPRKSARARAVKSKRARHAVETSASEEKKGRRAAERAGRRETENLLGFREST